MLNHMAYGLLQVLQWSNLLDIIVGVMAGLIIGALPGLSVVLGVALLLPFTFGMSPAAGILILIGVYCGGTFGGSISAILLNTPGTPGSAATTVDGFALAQQGKARDALNLSLYSSFAGGLMSGIVLLLLAPQIAKVAIHFGPPAFFTLALFGITIIASVSGKSLGKGLVMAGFGMLFATVGMDPINGEPRFTFGMGFLDGGIGLIPALIGLFALSEVFNQIEMGAKSIARGKRLKIEGKFSIRRMFPFRGGVVRAGIIGISVGAVPGTGGAIASFIAYSQAKRASKKPELFGQGSMEGIVASETANNGTTGATLIPMMTLGIPGDVVTAILLGALTVHGLTPGPRLFIANANLVYTVLVGFIICNIVMFILGKLAIKWFAKVSIIPSQFLLPVVLGLSLLGSYANTNSLSAVGITLAFGAIGYIMRKFDYPLPPMLIGMILGPIAETALRQSLLMSNGSLTIFFTRPFALFFIILFLLSLALPFIQKEIASARSR